MSKKYAELCPYTPGEQPRDMQYIKLNTNESPFPPSPKAQAVIDGRSKELLRLYPDPQGTELIDAISEVYGIPAGNLFVTGGSDEALAYAFMSFCDENTPAVFPDVTYGFYPVVADLLKVPVRRVPLKDFRLQPQDYYSSGGTIVIANPNAPTGIAIPLSAVSDICIHNPDNVVILDEAYVDFGAESALKLLHECPNLLVVQTFSKSRSLAGGRISFSAAAEEIISDLNRIKFSINPYDLTRLSIAAGAAAVRDTGYFQDCRAKIIETRKFVSAELCKLNFNVIDSQANFLFASPRVVAGIDYYRELKKRGILVRHFPGALTKDYVRITIGTRAQMEEFIEKTKEILEEQTV